MADVKFEKYDLNPNVDRFIGDYNKALRNAHIVTDIGEFHFPGDLRNFIESKAVYAELRWPFIYHDHCMKNEGETEYAQRMFTWEQFEKSIDFGFPILNLTDSDINKHVLYRIIERGGNRIGPRRGVLFAQDFELDINVPVAYAIDWSDPYLYDFLKPLVQQLDLNMLCPANYFCRTSDSLNDIQEVRLKDVLESISS